MHIQPLDYLVHFSNVLLLVAYSVRDMLWLRWFAVAAALDAPLQQLFLCQIGPQSDAI